MKLYKLKLFLSKNLTDFWYWLMKPLAYFFTTEKINARYNKKKAKITKDKAIKWIAEDMVRHVLERKNNEIDLLICDYASEDSFWSDCSFYTKPYYITRPKSKMAFYKFKKWNVELQIKLIKELQKYKDITITETVETFSNWERIDNYQKTVSIKRRV